MTCISVIIPTYNRAELTAEAVRSVLAQTYEDYEVIVIDDGSTDDTEAVIKAFTDPRVKYLKQSNGGAASASNTGLQVAKGEWIAFLDSDDLFLPEKFALQMAAIKREPDAGVVYGWYYGITTKRTKKKLVGHCGDPYPLADLLMGPIFHWSTVMMKRSILQEVGFFDLNFWVGEDWELTIRVAMTQCKFVCVPEPVATVRIQEVSLSRDIHKHASSGRGVLDKTFQSPAFPKTLVHLCDRAYASHLIRVAASAYLSDSPQLGQDPLAKALETDRTLLSENREHLLTKLYNYFQGLSLEDPEKTLQQMTENLPGPQTFSKQFSKELWGRYFLNRAFRAYRAKQKAACQKYAFQALRRDPGNVMNRGLISILLRSIVGGSLFYKQA